MNALLTYIFKHSYYLGVKESYHLVNDTYKVAYSVWLENQSQTLADDFESKVYIHEHISEIKEVKEWIYTTNQLASHNRQGLIWFLNENGKEGSLQDFHYSEYKLIANNAEAVKRYQSYLDTYHRLYPAHKAAVIRFLSADKETHTYDEIKKIALNETLIRDYAAVLKKAQECREKYPSAWKAFAHGRKLEDISIYELRGIDESKFDSKDWFLRAHIKFPRIAELICGTSLLPVDSFAPEAIEQEEDLRILMIHCYPEHILSDIPEFNRDVHLDNEKKLKAAILDSTRYGNDVNFNESFTVSDFISYRTNFDKLEICFDDAVHELKENLDAVKAYNQAHSGKSVSYIEDYYRIITPESPLKKFVESYKVERENRRKAKNICNWYPKGFKAIYGALDLDTCPLTTIISIIDSESRIADRHRSIEEQERLQREIERKRLEEERKRQEIRELKSCVSSWPQPRRSTVECFSLYYYYPTTCDWDASEDEWDVRNLVWDFKANPNRPQSESEIRRRHERAMNDVLPGLRRVLNHFFGSQKTKLTLVCIPSSKRIVSERRYKDFSERLCNDTGMDNGYSHVHVVSDGEATHLGGSDLAEFSIDRSYFKDRYVILFDDVITTGSSMERFRRMLESAGATVIGGMSIGKTKHERQFSNPIDQI